MSSNSSQDVLNQKLAMLEARIRELDGQKPAIEPPSAENTDLKFMNQLSTLKRVRMANRTSNKTYTFETLELKLAQIEVEIYPRLELYGLFSKSNGVVQLKRTDSTPVLPEFDDFQFWKAPVVDIEFESEDPKQLAEEYVEKCLEASAFNESSPDERYSSLLRRVTILEKLLDSEVPKPDNDVIPKEAKKDSGEAFILLGDAWVTKAFYDEEMRRRAEEKERIAKEEEIKKSIDSRLMSIQQNGGLVADSENGQTIVIQHSPKRLDQNNVPLSSDTLVGGDFTDILGEKDVPSFSKETVKSSFKHFIENRQSQEDGIKENTPKSRYSLSLFRFLNLLRSLVTTSYSIYELQKGLQNALLLEIGAYPILVAAMVMACIDVYIAFVRAFPKVLWICWDVSTWDPLSKSWSIWALIADHDLLIDVIPVLSNFILRVYVYRITEVISNPAVKSLLADDAFQISDYNSPKVRSLALAGLFGVSVVYVILFHALQLWHVLMFKKRSPTLGLLVTIKALLLIFDILTNSLLLYAVLVNKGVNICSQDWPTQLILAIVIPSPIVTLTTNSLINTPMHYFFLKMQLKDKQDPETGESGANVSFSRILSAALRKAFHPVIEIVFGPYTLFSCTAMLIVLSVVIDHVKTTSFQDAQISSGIIPNAGIFSFKDSSHTILTMAWTNFSINYLFGILSAVGYAFVSCFGMKTTRYIEAE